MGAVKANNTGLHQKTNQNVKNGRALEQQRRITMYSKTLPFTTHLPCRCVRKASAPPGRTYCQRSCCWVRGQGWDPVRAQTSGLGTLIVFVQWSQIFWWTIPVPLPTTSVLSQVGLRPRNQPYVNVLDMYLSVKLTTKECNCMCMRQWLRIEDLRPPALLFLRLSLLTLENVTAPLPATCMMSLLDTHVALVVSVTHCDRSQPCSDLPSSSVISHQGRHEFSFLYLSILLHVSPFQCGTFRIFTDFKGYFCQTIHFSYYKYKFILSTFLSCIHSSWCHKSLCSHFAFCFPLTHTYCMLLHLENLMV